MWDFGTPVEINPNTGFCGRTDLLMNHPVTKRALASFEFKITILRVPKPWNKEAKSIVAQTLQSWFSHVTEYSVAMTEHGLKVLTAQTSARDGATKLSQYPPRDEILRYRENRKAFLQVLLTIIKLSLPLFGISRCVSLLCCVWFYLPSICVYRWTPE